MRLVVFAKAPVIGGAKTRLAAGVGKVEAWRVHRAMTAGILRTVRGRRWTTVLAVSPDRALRRRFPGVWPDGLARSPQGGGDLGARQARVLSCGFTPPRPSPQGEGGELRRMDRRHGGRALKRAQIFRRRGPSVFPPPRGRVAVGGGATLVVGTDAPQVTRGDIAAAFKALKRHDAVIGPAEDGGYWLLGLARPAPPGLFDAVRWSHEETRADLEARLAAFGLTRIARLRGLRDVDHASDLGAVKRRGRP